MPTSPESPGLLPAEVESTGPISPVIRGHGHDPIRDREADMISVVAAVEERMEDLGLRFDQVVQTQRDSNSLILEVQRDVNKTLISMSEKIGGLQTNCPIHAERLAVLEASAHANQRWPRRPPTGGSFAVGYERQEAPTPARDLPAVTQIQLERAADEAVRMARDEAGELGRQAILAAEAAARTAASIATIETMQREQSRQVAEAEAKRKKEAEDAEAQRQKDLEAAEAKHKRFRLWIGTISTVLALLTGGSFIAALRYIAVASTAVAADSAKSQQAVKLLRAEKSHTNLLPAPPIVIIVRPDAGR